MNVCMCVCVGVWGCVGVGGWEVERGNRPYSRESPSHASLLED